MKACIYARTCRAERLHNTTSIDNQVAYCRELAQKHSLTVEDGDVYTDVEIAGSVLPTCWAYDDQPARPALSAMIEAIEAGRVSRIIVRRLEKLGTSSEVLMALLDLMTAEDARVVTGREQLESPDDPSGVFAASILAPRIEVDTEEERQRKAKLKAKKSEEIHRLQDRIARLEAEISEL